MGARRPWVQPRKPRKPSVPSVKRPKPVYGELPAPPVGSYDPALDYEAGTAKRGFGWTLEDIGPGGQGTITIGGETFDAQTPGRFRVRATTDYNTNKARLAQQKQWGLDDIDLSYDRLGSSQAQGAAARGVTSSGIMAQSKAARDANEGRETFRFTEQSNQADIDLDKGYQRQNEDWDIEGQRSGISLQDFLTGVDQQKAYSSGFTGTRPKIRVADPAARQNLKNNPELFGILQAMGAGESASERRVRRRRKGRK